MGLEKILKMLDVDYGELKRLIFDKLGSFTKKEKNLIFDFLCRNSSILLMFLSDDISPEEAILLAMKAEMGLDNTEIDLDVRNQSPAIQDDSDVINAVVFAGAVLIVCLLERQNKQNNHDIDLTSFAIKNKVGR